METIQTPQSAVEAPSDTILYTGRVGRRGAAYLIDGALITVALAVGMLMIALAYAMALSTLMSCSVSRAGDCDPSIWWDRVVVSAMIGWIIASVHVVLVRPVRRGRSTYGMRQVGIEVVSQQPGRALSNSQLHTRAWSSHPLLWLQIASLVMIGVQPTWDSGALETGLFFTAVTLIAASALAIVAPGHRSIADAITNTRVIRVRPVSYAAGAAGLIVPPVAVGTALAVQLWGLDTRPGDLDSGVRFSGRNYDGFDQANASLQWFYDLAEWFTTGPAHIAGLAAIWIACCGASWFALRDTRWRTERKAGRGLALTAALCTASAPITLAGLGVAALATWIVEQLG